MTDRTTPRATIASLSHDLLRKRSVVGLVWADDPEKSLALPVPFGCSLGDLQAEAERALRALAVETAALTVEKP